MKKMGIMNVTRILSAFETINWHRYSNSEHFAFAFRFLFFFFFCLFRPTVSIRAFGIMPVRMMMPFQKDRKKEEEKKQPTHYDDEDNMTKDTRRCALIEAEIIPYLSHVIHSIISFR